MQGQLVAEEFSGSRRPWIIPIFRNMVQLGPLLCDGDGTCMSNRTVRSAGACDVRNEQVDIVKDSRGSRKESLRCSLNDVRVADSCTRAMSWSLCNEGGRFAVLFLKLTLWGRSSQLLARAARCLRSSLNPSVVVVVSILELTALHPTVSINFTSAQGGYLPRFAPGF